MPSSAPARTELVAAVAAVIAVLAVPGTVGAADQQSEQLAVGTALQAFVTEDNPEETLGELRAAMRRGVDDQWEVSGELAFDVVSRQRLQDRITDDSLYDGTLELARQWGEMGIEAYKRLETDEAVEHLERSLQNYEEISHDLIAPEEVSEVEMYLALSYLEDGIDVVRPLDVLRDMIRRDPDRKLERGYYPDFIVQYYENARETLFTRLRSEGPPTEESERIAQWIEADYVFHGYAIPVDGDQVELVAHLYDAEADQFLEPERLAVETIDAGKLEEGFGRLASRFSSRLVDDRAPGPEVDDDLTASDGTHPLGVELGMTYGSFLQVPAPLEEPFGNYGLRLGVSWSVTREFQVVAGLETFNSMRDYAGRLRDNFTTVRLMAGGELSRRIGPVSMGVAAGLEGARFGTIRALSDAQCIPDPDGLCPGDTGTTTFEDNDMHWGLQISPRVDWALSDSFNLAGTVRVGYYVSPLENQLLNFPVTTDVGIRYRF